MDNAIMCTGDARSLDDVDVDDDLLVPSVLDEFEHVRIEITGITKVVGDGNNSNNNNGDWDVESYANDSIPLAKLRIMTQHQHQHRFIHPEEEDWTVQSDCNDSVVLTTQRLSLRMEQDNDRVGGTVTLQRIPRRRRASMGEVCVVGEQHQQMSSVPSPPSAQVSSDPMEGSLVVTSSRYSDSAATTASESSDPVRGVTRHKSMPLHKSKSTPGATLVPMWRPRNKATRMPRRFSNSNGTNCAA